MPTYLLESYGADRDDTLADARRRALRTAGFGVDVRYLHTTFLPGEQTLLHVFEAASLDALSQAARRAELSYERIVEAVEAPPEPAIGVVVAGPDDAFVADTHTGRIIEAVDCGEESMKEGRE